MNGYPNGWRATKMLSASTRHDCEECLQSHCRPTPNGGLDNRAERWTGRGAIGSLWRLLGNDGHAVIIRGHCALAPSVDDRAACSTIVRSGCRLGCPPRLCYRPTHTLAN